MPKALILALSKSPDHTFSKQNVDAFTLLEGLGVEGDAHMGKTVQHVSRLRKDPTQPNLRQVHLMHAELFDELADKGFVVKPGELGENITTRGIDLLHLPKDTILRLGDQAEVQITGLRNPCKQISAFQSGLMAELLDRDEDGNTFRKSGVMGIVKKGGEVRKGDVIQVILPKGTHEKLEVV